MPICEKSHLLIESSGSATWDQKGILGKKGLRKKINFKKIYNFFTTQRGAKFDEFYRSDLLLVT